ncbi:MAG: DNA (cytosine-5-)-methyltransferase [bacterium]
MMHGSLFAGVGGFDLGFERAEFETLWQVEIDPFCRAVLKTRFPQTEILEDVKECGANNLKPVDVLTGGFPCQDLSVAGKRAGLAGSRSGLFYEFMRIADEIAPTWICLENVPGLFSSPEGRAGEDFALVLGEVAGCRPEVPEGGWRSAGVCLGPKRSAAWRVLDSRYFGVAQRRRRVFIVAGPGAASAAAVLFEPESGAGDFKKGRKARADVAFALAASAGSHIKNAWNTTYIAATLSSASHDKSHAADAEALTSQELEGRMSVRRLTPIECERLQGFPDGWTIPAEDWHGNGKKTRSDKALQGMRQTDAPNSREGRRFGESASLSEAEVLQSPVLGQVGVGKVEEGECQGTSGMLSGEDCEVADPMRTMRFDKEGGQASQRRESAEQRSIEHREPLPQMSHETSRLAESSWKGQRCEVRDSEYLPQGLDSARYRALGNAVTVQVAEWIAMRIALVEMQPQLFEKKAEQMELGK